MNCPTCGHNKSSVIDSRASKGIIRRRRACLQCTTRYTTYELDSDTLEKMTHSGGVGEAIDLVFGVLDMMQDMVGKKLNAVRQSLPGSYLKLKPAKVEEKRDMTSAEEIEKFGEIQ